MEHSLKNRLLGLLVFFILWGGPIYAALAFIHYLAQNDTLTAVDCYLDHTFHCN